MIIKDAKNCLEFLVGDWAGEEDIAPSRWGDGGKAVAKVSARLELNGRVLLQDYRAERDGKPWFNAHAVMTFGEQTSAFGLYWFDSMGFVPAQPAQGLWNGEALQFVRESPRGQTRHSYVLLGAHAYELFLESSFDSGSTWEPVMKGCYSKAAPIRDF